MSNVFIITCCYIRSRHRSFESAASNHWTWKHVWMYVWQEGLRIDYFYFYFFLCRCWRLSTIVACSCLAWSENIIFHRLYNTAPELREGSKFWSFTMCPFPTEDISNFTAYTLNLYDYIMMEPNKVLLKLYIWMLWMIFLKIRYCWKLLISHMRHRQCQRRYQYSFQDHTTYFSVNCMLILQNIDG